ncbi:hypothetical protein, partial [Desulfovibrio sp.]|uniref:hypothetical protein n=1 Tax=Desulfovibrio sp. TaxID=885 RepID=UPI0030788AEA
CERAKRRYFIILLAILSKKDTQETGCRKRQDFLHMILPKSLKKAKRFLVDRQQAEERPRGRFGGAGCPDEYDI